MCMSALPNPDVGEGIEPLSPAVERRLRVIAALVLVVGGLVAVVLAMAGPPHRKFFEESSGTLRVIATGLGITLLAGGTLLMGRAVRYRQRQRNHPV